MSASNGGYVSDDVRKRAVEDQEEREYQERMAEARKKPGIVIRSTYDEEGKLVRSEEFKAEKAVPAPKGRLSRIRERLTPKKLTEEELEKKLRIERKRTELLNLKKKQAEARRERTRAAFQTFDQFMAKDLPGTTKGKKQPSGGGLSEFYGMKSMGPGIKQDFDYASFMMGTGRKSAKSDFLKDFYGL